jgi:rare lipoprotein A
MIRRAGLHLVRPCFYAPPTMQAEPRSTLRHYRPVRSAIRHAAVVALFAVPLSAAIASSTAEDNAADAALPIAAELEQTIQASALPATSRPIAGGSASYYAAKFHGRPTANGERFDNGAMTAAHRTLPFGSVVRVTNPANGKSVTVRINDRGPFTKGRVIDVSRAAAVELGLIAPGHARVELELVEG